MRPQQARAHNRKYPRPGNVEGLRTPRVNPLIWNQIPAQVRTSDSKSQKSQNAIVASIVAMVKATNLVLEQEDEHATAKDKAVVSTLTDAITLAMQCFHDMNSSRRQAMKKELRYVQNQQLLTVKIQNYMLYLTISHVFERAKLSAPCQNGGPSHQTPQF